jgi:uncharacterized protein (DUF433 family)
MGNDANLRRPWLVAETDSMTTEVQRGDDPNLLVEVVPGVCSGRPVIKGTRIPVWVIEHARRDGMSLDDIIEMYPSLDRTRILAALKWADEHRDQIDSEIYASTVK